MKDIEKWLQLSLVALVIFSTSLLGNGLGSIILPSVGFICAISAFLLTDRLGIIRLDRFVANMAAILVAAYSIFRFFDEGTGGAAKLSAIADLLIYVQLVLLFQEKSPQLYWHIWILSLLQVVVAAALNVQFQVGLMFIAFIVLAITSMTLMASFRQEDSDEETKPATDSGNPKNVRAQFMSLARRHSATPIEAKPPRGLVQLLISCGLGIGALSLLFSIVFFYSIPRFDEVWQGHNYAQINMVGFSRQVEFGDESIIANSNRKVFTAFFVENDGKVGSEATIVQLNEEPYFRGIVLNKFAPDNSGKWSWRTEYGANVYVQKPLEFSKSGIESDSDTARLVRQLITLSPSTENIAFSMFPAFGNSNTPNVIRYEASNEHMINTDMDRVKFAVDPTNPIKLDYELLVGVFRNNRPYPAVPYVDPTDKRTNVRPMQEVYRRQLTTYDPNRVRGLVAYAEEVKAKVANPDNTRLLSYRLSESLRQDQEFSYTLDYTDVNFDRTIDPLEDFVVNHKTGHCEYFAGALAVMLRSQGIPARLVVGFKGGEYNTVGEFYDVQEKHAHVWVEAYIPQEQCDVEMIETGQAKGGGAWLRLDPTPGGEGSENNVAEAQNAISRTNDAFGYAQKIWEDYVVGLDRNKQRKSFLSPSDKGFIASMFGDDIESGDGIELGFQKFNGENSSIIRFGILGLLGVMLFFAFNRRRLNEDEIPMRAKIAAAVNDYLPSLAKLIYADVESLQVDLQGKKVEFYEEFLALLNRHGISKSESQTQAELAQHVLGTVADKVESETESQTLQKAIQKITDSFYLVRFGNQDLSQATEKELENELKVVDAALSQLSRA